MYITQNFKLLRKVFGYTQKEIAPLLDLKPSMVSQIECGAKMQEYTKKLACTVFGITPEQFENQELTLEEVQLLKVKATNNVASDSSDTATDAHFKNDISRRFYDWYQGKFDTKELTLQQAATDLNLGKTSYSYEFWHLLKKGKVSVDVQQLYLSHIKHGLDLNFVFGLKDAAAPFSYVADTDVAYTANYNDDTAAAELGRKIDAILTKHRTPRASYAEHELLMTPRNLQRIVKGEVKPSFLLVAKIAEDHGESLDIFRSKPLPKGHLLSLLQEKEKHIEALEETIRTLRSKS